MSHCSRVMLMPLPKARWNLQNTARQARLCFPAYKRNGFAEIRIRKRGPARQNRLDTTVHTRSIRMSQRPGYTPALQPGTTTWSKPSAYG